jgi:hypothetical protein
MPAGPITGAKVDASSGRGTHLQLVFQQFIFNAALTNTTAYVAAVQPGAAGVLNTHTIAAQPDVPRCPTLTLTDANSSITGFEATVYGTDYWGESAQDTKRITTLGTQTIDFDVVFRTFTKITSKVTSGTVTGGSDTVSFGRGNWLGLAAKIAAAADVLSVKEGELEGGSGAAVDALAADAAVINARYWRFDPIVNPNGVIDYVLEIKSTYSDV